MTVIAGLVHLRVLPAISTTSLSIGGLKLARDLPSGCAAEFKPQLVGSWCRIPYIASTLSHVMMMIDSSSDAPPTSTAVKRLLS